MSKKEAFGRLALLVFLFAAMILAIDANRAGYSALFAMLFGTALERLILNRS